MIDKNNIPQHIAIIMDGNGRWAEARGLPRTAGHREGAKRVKEIVKAARELGVKVVTFFAFSSENWSRPKREINFLMRYLDNFLVREIKDMDKNNIRFLSIGRDEPLPLAIQKRIKEAEAKTRDNTGLTVVLAFNYGSRQEIVDAAKKFAGEVISSKTDLNALDEGMFSRYLYTDKLPDPDLLIRTSAELRVSNFLLWQLAYAELYFPKKFWPDFKADDLKEAIEEYQSRKRRFGGI
ncbi:MAG: isoprenyl transferase [Candidatus Omnitrophota bacterium]|nr:isoprenyl transferase [Candidatus Omnitrophota bacterium]